MRLGKGAGLVQSYDRLGVPPLLLLLAWEYREAAVPSRALRFRPLGWLAGLELPGMLLRGPQQLRTERGGARARARALTDMLPCGR